jgi:hypothetical protein
MKSLVHAQYVTCDESPLYVDYFLYCAYVRLFYLVPFLIFNQFLDQIPQNWADFSVWFRLFGLVRSQFWADFLRFGREID